MKLAGIAMLYLSFSLPFKSYFIDSFGLHMCALITSILCCTDLCLDAHSTAESKCQNVLQRESFDVFPGNFVVQILVMLCRSGIRDYTTSGIAINYTILSTLITSLLENRDAEHYVLHKFRDLQYSPKDENA